MRITVVGIGNALAADDGVGIHAVAELRHMIHDERVRFLDSERGGLDLLDHLAGSDIGILIDAAKTGIQPPGSPSEFTLQKPYTVGTPSSFHTIGLDAVLAFGEIIGMPLPNEVTVVAVEGSDFGTFRERLSDAVTTALPNLIGRVGNHLLTFVPDLRLSGGLDTLSAGAGTGFAQVSERT